MDAPSRKADATMTEQEFREALACMLEESEDAFEGSPRVRSFGESGLLTSNEGLVVRLEDGSEFQLQIVRSR